ncbi:unnamed protein product [Allacma fusca]|uniref:C2H2-type domain-containing protein n=1 Tax=Allacma fusca TaxID=39272 RepID=A0A8J2K9U5_9HEXA|nr:unnamed protein product [Allacma fusca]
MYKLYRDFSHRSTDKSFLYRRKEKVEEVLEKWYSTTEPEPELEHAVTAQDVKPILQAGPILEEECELPVPLEAPVDEMDPLAIKEENPCGPGNNDIPGNSNKPTTSTSIRNSFFKGKKPKLEKWESHPSPKTEVVVPSLPTKDTESEFSCPKCRRNFQTAFQLSCHQVYCGTPSDLEKLVSNRFQCKVCNAYFNTEDAWQNHNQSQHFGKRPFIDCLYCPAKLPSLKVLQKHMRLHSQITDPKKISSAEEISTPNNEAAPVTQAAIPLGAPNIIVQSYLQKYLGDGKRKHGGHQKILK